MTVGWSGWNRGASVVALWWFFSSAGPALAVRCIGDCDTDLQVALGELVTCVDVALGGSGEERCPSCNGDGQPAVGIVDLIAAVANSLAQCPADLVPTSVSVRVVPSEGCVEDPKEIETSLVVCIANEGVTAAGAFSIDVLGEPYSSIEGLAGLAEQCVEGQLVTGEIDVVADLGQQVREDDEDNNRRVFSVGTPVLPPLCTATPTATATITGSRTATRTSTASPSATNTATETSTSTRTSTSTVSSTPTPSATATATPTTTATPTVTATATITPTPTPSATATRTPTATPTSDLPDLVPVDVRLIEACVDTLGGQPAAQLEVFVTNLGITASGPFNVTVNGEPFARVETGVQPDGAVFALGPVTVGTVEVRVDSDGEVEEFDEANNVFTTVISDPKGAPSCTATATATVTPTRTPTSNDGATPTATESPAPVSCPLDPGRYTMVQLEGSQLIASAIPPFAFASGGNMVLDVGPAPTAECVHPVTVPFPGGLNVPIFCIEELDPPVTVRLDQIGCGVGALDSNGGSDFTITQIGDTSDASATCNLPHLECTPGGDDAIRTEVTVGDGVPDVCVGGGTANLILSMRASIQAWLDPEECPDLDGAFDEGEDELFVSLSQTLDLTTATSRSDYSDLDGDGCCIAGVGPASVTSPCNEGSPEVMFTSTGACLNVQNRTVTAASTAPVGSSAPPLNDITFALQLLNVLTGPEPFSGATCSDPPLLDLDGTVTRCNP